MFDWKEKEQFGELYRYVKTEVMNYDSKQSLPSSFVLGLKGLATGKVVENKRQKIELIMGMILFYWLLN